MLLDNRHVSDTFTEWPLHITVIPWFRVQVSNDELGREFSRALSPMQPFLMTVDGEADFGHLGRKKVHLIATPTPLENIEANAREILHAHDAWLVDETTKRRQDFRPHVTVQPSGQIHTGDTLTCDSLYIIEQKGGYKEIVSRIEL